MHSKRFFRLMGAVLTVLLALMGAVVWLSTGVALPEPVLPIQVMTEADTLAQAQQQANELSALPGVEACLWLDDLTDTAQPAAMLPPELLNAWYTQGKALYLLLPASGQTLQVLEALDSFALAGSSAVFGKQAHTAPVMGALTALAVVLLSAPLWRGRGMMRSMIRLALGLTAVRCAGLAFPDMTAQTHLLGSLLPALPMISAMLRPGKKLARSVFWSGIGAALALSGTQTGLQTGTMLLLAVLLALMMDASKPLRLARVKIVFLTLIVAAAATVSAAALWTDDSRAINDVFGPAQACVLLTPADASASDAAFSRDLSVLPGVTIIDSLHHRTHSAMPAAFLAEDVRAALTDGQHHRWLIRLDGKQASSALMQTAQAHFPDAWQLLGDAGLRLRLTVLLRTQALPMALTLLGAGLITMTIAFFQRKKTAATKERIHA